MNEQVQTVQTLANPEKLLASSRLSLHLDTAIRYRKQHLQRGCVRRDKLDSYATMSCPNSQACGRS